MSTEQPQRPPKVVVPKKDVKILMLHGYTQSGPLFRAKTRAVEKLLSKSLAPFNLAPVLIYPTGPNRLRPSDIPGYEPPEGDGSEDKADEESDSWAWWRRDDATGSYRFLREGMQVLASTIREHNGVDGVIGFSQGACASSIVAAAMEPTRTVPESTGPEGGPHDWSWVEELRAANGHRGLRFAVIYSGFPARPAELQWLYKPQPLSTPTLHFIGGLDTIVDESQSQALADDCENATVLTHPGSHYVPVKKEWVMPLVAFVKQHSEEPIVKSDAKM